MEELKQHFAAYLMIITITRSIKEQVNAGAKEFDYALEMFENIKQMERDYIENKLPGFLANNN